MRTPSALFDSSNRLSIRGIRTIGDTAKNIATL
jgi:hypothetical protein